MKGSQRSIGLITELKHPRILPILPRDSLMLCAWRSRMNTEDLKRELERLRKGE